MSSAEMTKVASMVNALAANFPPEMFVSWNNNTASFFDHMFNLTRELLQMVSTPDSSMAHDEKESYLVAFNDILNAWVLFGQPSHYDMFLHYQWVLL